MEKTLDSKMSGIIELDKEELKEVDGGGFLILVGALLLTYVVVEAALNPQAHYDAFMEGREIAKGERN